MVLRTTSSFTFARFRIRVGYHRNQFRIRIRYVCILLTVPEIDLACHNPPHFGIYSLLNAPTDAVCRGDVVDDYIKLAAVVQHLPNQDCIG